MIPIPARAQPASGFRRALHRIADEEGELGARFGYSRRQNVDPYSAIQNAESFNGGGTSSLSPSPGDSPTPDLRLALNDATPMNANIASDVGGPNYIGPADAGAATDATDFNDWMRGAFEQSDVASDTGRSYYVGSFPDNGVTYDVFYGGHVYYEFPAATNTNPSTALPRPKTTTDPCERPLTSRFGEGCTLRDDGTVGSSITQVECGLLPRADHTAGTASAGRNMRLPLAFSGSARSCFT